MKGIAIVVLGAVLACAGCASHRDDPYIAMAMMEDVAAQNAASVRSWTQVEATILNPNEEFKSRHHTLLRMKGDKRKFRVLFGPLDQQWFELSGRNPNVLPESAFEAVGRSHNSEPSWEVDSGYAMLWGRWPTAWTRTVSIGAEGTTVFVAVEGTTEYVVLVEGRKATIRKLASIDPDEPVLKTITTPGFYVKIVGGVVQGEPTQVPADESDPLRYMLNLVEARRDSIEY